MLERELFIYCLKKFEMGNSNFIISIFNLFQGRVNNLSGSTSKFLSMLGFLLVLTSGLSLISFMNISFSSLTSFKTIWSSNLNRFLETPISRSNSLLLFLSDLLGVEIIYCLRVNLGGEGFSTTFGFTIFSLSYSLFLADLWLTLLQGSSNKELLFTI